MSTVITYPINKGINKSIEFKGLRAQYIWYAGAGMLCLMILYALLYLIGVNTYVGLVMIAIAGGFLLQKIYAMNAKYGEHGLMKILARKSIPKVVKISSRSVFTTLKGKSI